MGFKIRECRNEINMSQEELSKNLVYPEQSFQV